MSAALPFRFLAGRRDAILDVAATPAATVPALFFLLSAGLAREYDGESVLHAPWHFLRPLAVSTATGTVLFALVHGAAVLRRRGESEPPPLREAYSRFLTLFWWTAPLAWLYAVPYERFLGELDAIRANLATLGLVAAWRVALMIRVVQVVYGLRWWKALFLVMLFADAVAIAAMMLVPMPVIGIMGGLRYAEGDLLLVRTRGTVLALSVLSAPCWLLGALAQLPRLRPRWPDLRARGASLSGLRRVAVASLLPWIAVLPFTQPEQALRARTERLLRSGRVTEGLRAMSAHEPSDYPPYWDPPPRLGVERGPDLGLVVAALTAEPAAPWVVERYARKLDLTLPLSKTPSEVAAWQALLADWMEDPEHLVYVHENHLRAVRFLVESSPDATPEQRAWIARALAEREAEKSGPGETRER